MYELSLSQFQLARPLFDAAPYGVLAAGTLEGGHPGRIFVDNPARPDAALLCTRVGYYFLAGRPDVPFVDRLAGTFTTQLAPLQLQALGDPQILLFYPDARWHDPLFQAFADRAPLAIHKKRLTLPSVPAQRGARLYRCWRECLPAGFRLARMSAQFLDEHPEMAGEALLFWGSEKAFEQKSLGLCLVDEAAGGVVASACSGVFVGCGEIELSICTDPAYRRRGLGVLVAAAFIEASLRRGLRPVWGCFPENTPSMQMAQKLGFTAEADQPICFWEWKE